MSYTGPFPFGVTRGGTNATTFTNTNGTVYFDGTKLNSINPSNAGWVLTSNGAGSAPSYTSAGAWSWIAQKTASGSTSLTFTSGITTTYNNYALLFTDLVPATNGDTIIIQISSDGGLTYINSGYVSGINTLPYNGTTVTNANATTSFYAGTTLLNAVPGLGGWVYLFNMTKNGNVFSTAYTNGTATGPVPSMQLISGTYATNIIVNALSISGAGGNLTSGTVSLFGLRES